MDRGMIARVFPTRTSMTPTDQDAYFSYPDLFTPKYDEVHISTVFTWDIPKARVLAKAWEDYGKVKIGGCAFGNKGGEFVPGMYLKKGITITSRGCPNRCSFCFVPKREGKLRELPIVEGNIIQDNNFLACSKEHRQKVYQMLVKQKGICFKGGLEARRLTDWDINQLRELAIKELWFACDHKNAIRGIREIAYKMTKYFASHKLLCYVLIGDDMIENEARLKAVFNAGMYPFAQLFRDGHKTYAKKWRDFARTWSRPAAYKTLMRKNG